MPTSSPLILFTRPAPRADAFVRVLAPLGARVTCIEAIRHRPLAGALAHPPQEDAPCHWLLFTSAVAVTVFFDALATQPGLTALIATSPASAQVLAVGPATAQALAARGWHAALRPTLYNAVDAARAFVQHAGDGPPQTVLWPCATLSDTPPIASLFKAAGHRLVPWPVYQTEAHPDLSAALASLPAPPDALAITSPSCVDALANALAGALADVRADHLALPAGAGIIAIGPSTARRARERFGRCDAMADEHTTQGLAWAVARTLRMLPQEGPPP